MNLTIANIAANQPQLAECPVIELRRSEAVKLGLSNGLKIEVAGDLADVAKSFDVLIGMS